ncbi:MAG: adenosylcobalamin-dependent ribonucleoside-diphosphate reductase [Candidatus Magasanikbacteria bacterium]
MENFNPSKEKVNNSFTDNSLKMMKKRYLSKRGEEATETPAEMFERVAESLAEVEKDYGHNTNFVNQKKKEFFEIMGKQEFTPAGRTLANCGAKTALIANCIVLPIRDSMEGIFQTMKEAALLQQAGSGLGFAFDSLRPAMEPTIRSQGYASGPVSFLKVYDEAFGTIKQQKRHGANMAMMSINHPDVLDFVKCKAQEGEITNFNISVKVTDEFMNKLKEDPDQPWYCEWDGEKTKPRKVLRHPDGTVYDYEELDKTVGEMFEEISKYAWVNGEPGVAFIDTVNKGNPLPGLGDIPASNPCGEQFLHPYDNCNLGSINLSQFVKDDSVDFDRLRYVAKVSTRLLDNVIDKFEFPVDKVNEMASRNRRIGLGIMGFADMLYQLGIPYDSEEGRQKAREVMGTIQEAAEETSEELAVEKGPFPNYKKSIFDEGNRRNAALTTVAPTGSISMMFDTSGGVEPNFALAYVKQDKDGDQYHYLNKYFIQALKEKGFSEEKIEEIKEEVVENGSIQHLDLPQDLKDTFVTAMDISGEDHIRAQAAFQQSVDNSISKTINLPNEATKEDVRDSFMLAWELGCKACTVYREGSRQVQIMNLGEGDDVIAPSDVSKEELKEKAEDSEIENIEDGSEIGELEKGQMDAKEEPSNASEDKTEEAAEISEEFDFPKSAGNGGEGKLSPRERPEEMSGKTYKMKTGYGNLYITVNDDEHGDPFEVFATIGKSGGFFQEQSEAICRLISLSLRAGVSIENIIKQLKGIRGPMPVITNKGTVLSLPDAIARVLEDHTGRNFLEEGNEDALEDGQSSEVEQKAEVQARRMQPSTADSDADLADYGMMPGCPECGAPLQISEGCMSCRSCGFSRCG